MERSCFTTTDIRSRYAIFGAAVKDNIQNDTQMHSTGSTKVGQARRKDYRCGRDRGKWGLVFRGAVSQSGSWLSGFWFVKSFRTCTSTKRSSMCVCTCDKRWYHHCVSRVLHALPCRLPRGGAALFQSSAGRNSIISHHQGATLERMNASMPAMPSPSCALHPTMLTVMPLVSSNAANVTASSPADSGSRRLVAARPPPTSSRVPLVLCSCREIFKCRDNAGLFLRTQTSNPPLSVGSTSPEP